MHACTVASRKSEHHSPHALQDIRNPITNHPKDTSQLCGIHYMYVCRVIVFSRAMVQHMERRYQALTPDLSKTGRDYQAQGRHVDYTLNPKQKLHMRMTIQVHVLDNARIS